VAAIGIDLGTTYSAVAAVGPDGESTVLPNREGSSVTPSVVCFQGERPLVGMAARRAVSVGAGECVEFVKRHMADPSWRFVTERGTAYTAEQISALILRRVAEDAATALDEPCREAVITVPAYFDDARRRATADAAHIAGLDVLRIVNEPTAAALAFGYGADRDETLLVYDLGGGTFDCTVMRMGRGRFDVLATAGDRNLGGFDVDNALMLYVAERIDAAGGPWLFDSSLDDGTLEDALRQRCEQAKRMLSTLPEARVVIDVKGVDYTVELTRLTFEDLTRPLLRRTEEIVLDVLDEARVTRGTLGSVLLVGGSTRMPMVAAMVQRVTGVRPDRSVHPDEVVALGAGILADVVAKARRGGGPRPQRTVVVHDVTSHGLGVLARAADTGEQVNSVVIPRNTPIPAKGARRYRTLAENQREVLLVVTEGDDEDHRYVTVVGSTRLAVPARSSAVEVDVVISYDADGIISVTLVEAGTDRALGEFEIDRQANLDAAEVDRMRAALRSLQDG